MSPVQRERVEEEVFRRIAACGRAYGATVPDLARQLGLSQKTVHGHVRSLARARRIKAVTHHTGKRGRPPLAWFPA